MKKLLSAAAAFAAAASMALCVSAAEPTIQQYNAVDALIGGIATFAENGLSIAKANQTIDKVATPTVKYYAAPNYGTAAEIAYDLGPVKQGDSVKVDMTFKLSDPGRMQQLLFVLPEEQYNDLKVKKSTDYYDNFLKTYADYKETEGNLYNEKLRDWSVDSATINNIDYEGHLIACVVGAATTTKLTSHVAWFDVTVTPTQEEEQSLTLTSVGNILEDDNGYGKVFTFEANLGDKQLSDMVLKYDDTPATLLEGTAAPSIDGNAKFGIIVKSVSREKIESFDGSDVTLSFN